MIFMLKEIRCTREAIDAAEATAIANAPRPPPLSPVVNILTVPSGTFIDDAMRQRIERDRRSFSTPAADRSRRSAGARRSADQQEIELRSFEETRLTELSNSIEQLASRVGVSLDRK